MEGSNHSTGKQSLFENLFVKFWQSLRTMAASSKSHLYVIKMKAVSVAAENKIIVTVHTVVKITVI